jgi:N-glycosylase/DNA lyase
MPCAKILEMKNEDYERLRSSYLKRKDLISARLREFKEVFEKGDDNRIFEELAFCMLTSAVGPKMGQKSIDAIKDVLIEGSEEDIYEKLLNVHKYPEKASFVARARDYLKNEFDFKLKELVLSFEDPLERRDFFALNKNIKGIGFVQSSHFLRNIGFSEYAILDKNIVLSLYQFGVIDSPKPPTTRKKYLEIESKLKGFAKELGIGVDELDLLLWSEKTGHIPR